MKVSAIIAVAFVASVSSLAAAWAGETPTTNDGIWSCQSLGDNGPFYQSSVFAVAANANAIKTAFAQMLGSKYGYKGDVTCSMAYRRTGVMEKLQSDQKSYALQLHNAGRNVVQTGWSYSGPTARSGK
jgi:hypothetical protein